MVTDASGGQAAPEELEPVRRLLNSWLIPNDTRQATDRFEDFAREHEWRRRDAGLVRELRDDLRRVLESGRAANEQSQAASDDCINHWITRLGLRVALADGHLSYTHDGGAAGEFLTAVVHAIANGTWSRLKACPDCRWVFYDHTRNGSKRWCLMYAGGPSGRACGTIAKVRRYRDKHATPTDSAKNQAATKPVSVR
jgi:predicted RNA-binding Zn ribbon-like protein